MTRSIFRFVPLLVALTAATSARGELPSALLKHREGLVAFWDFQEKAGEPRVARGSKPYALREMNGPIARSEEGVFGPGAASIRPGQWFMIERPELDALDIHGANAQVTVVAWVRRVGQSSWQAIAGVWDETRGQRQYCLFLNAPRGTRVDEMKRYPLQNRIHGHVSPVGGPTPGEQFCITYSSGATEIPLHEWHCLAMTYDGRASRVYVDGKLDALEHYNPFAVGGGLFDGGKDGSPFTVGAVHRGGSWGNFFGGQIGGLAVFRRALDDAEMLALAQGVPLPGARPALLKTADFETGDLSQIGMQKVQDDSITLVTSPVRTGKFAAKTLLRASDPEVHGGQRAEFSDGRKTTKIEMEKDYWYGLSIFVPEDFSAPTKSNAVLFQWHTQQGGPSPVLAIRMRGEEWLITGNATEKRRTLAKLPLVKGRWTDWVVHARWSAEPKGFWTVWQGGVEVVSERDIVTQYPEALGPYAKFGQYHSVSETSQNVVYFDEYRVAGPGGSYEQVAPGGKSPSRP